MDYDAWLQGQSATAISPSRRAIAAWRRIQQNPASVTVVRGDGTSLSAQTVRLVMESGTGGRSESTGEIVNAAERDVLLFGIADHPTFDDTDVQKGDQFYANDLLHRVVEVAYYPGEVQARCEVQQ